MRMLRIILVSFLVKAEINNKEMIYSIRKKLIQQNKRDKFGFKQGKYGLYY